MLLSSFVDFLLKDTPNNWRLMVAVPAVPGALLLFVLCLLPESPRWLVQVGDFDGALAALDRLRKQMGRKALATESPRRRARHEQPVGAAPGRCCSRVASEQQGPGCR